MKMGENKCTRMVEGGHILWPHLVRLFYLSKRGQSNEQLHSLYWFHSQWSQNIWINHKLTIQCQWKAISEQWIKGVHKIQLEASKLQQHATLPLDFSSNGHQQCLSVTKYNNVQKLMYKTEQYINCGLWTDGSHVPHFLLAPIKQIRPLYPFLSCTCKV